MADTQYHVAANFAQSPYAMLTKSGVDTPLEIGSGTQRIEDIPALVRGDSFDLHIYCYADYNRTTKQYWDAGISPSTCKLYIQRLNSNETALEIEASGTTDQSGQTEYWKLSFTVDADAITSYYDNQDVLIYAVVANGTEKRRILMETKVLALSGDASQTVETSDLIVTTRRVVGFAAAPAVTDDSASNYAVGDYIWDNGGSQLYRCDDASVGAAVWTSVSALDDETGMTFYHVDATTTAVTCTLPNATIDGSTAIITVINATNATTVTGTIWGDPLTLDSLATAWLHWRDNDSQWYNLNLSVVVS